MGFTGSCQHLGSERRGRSHGKVGWPGHRCQVYLPHVVAASFLTVTFALCCFGKNASGTMHTVWVPTFQKRHQEVRKQLAKEHRRKPNSTECQEHSHQGCVGSLSDYSVKIMSFLIVNFFSVPFGISMIPTWK